MPSTQTTEIDDLVWQRLRDSAQKDPGDALTLTALGEARGDDHDGSSLEERVAVMCVIRNRVIAERYGGTWAAVMFGLRQFSCWNAGDSNRAYLLNLWESLSHAAAIDAATLALWNETSAIARLVIDHTMIDRTGCATGYYAPASMKPAGRVPTQAAGKPYRTIGTQRFYVI